MGRLLKAVFFLGVLAALIVGGYAIFSDLEPAREVERVPVPLSAP